MAKKVEKVEEAAKLTKNFAALGIYFILKKHTDLEHKITQEQIAKYLYDEYGIVLERKAIGRILDGFEEMNIEIGRDRKGAWYADPDDLEPYELKLLVDSVFCNRAISETDTEKLIKKLCDQTSEYFKQQVNYTYTTEHLSKNASRALFTNIDLIERAIQNKKQISFNYYKWGTDKKLHISSSQVVSPYRIVVHAGKYYLKALNEDLKSRNKESIWNFKLDHIADLKILENSKATPVRSIPGFESGMLNQHYGTNLPYMYTDKEDYITFLVKECVVDQVVEWLGDTVEFSEKTVNPGIYKATIKSSPLAFKWFAMQYIDEIEVLSPKSLRNDIALLIKDAAKKYGD